ncbi:MAG: hypothetical protein ACMXYB_02775 [Candidatus Woesearchaeota archaeon]
MNRPTYKQITREVLEDADTNYNTKKARSQINGLSHAINEVGEIAEKGNNRANLALTGLAALALAAGIGTAKYLGEDNNQTQTPIPTQTQTQTPIPTQTQTQTPIPTQTQVLDAEVSRSLESKLYTPQECSVAEMRGIQDTLNFYNQSGERVGTTTQVNWENNTRKSFGDRMVDYLQSNILEPTGIYNAISLTFQNPGGNDFRVSYSPRNAQELVEFLNNRVRGDCTSGEYAVTIEGMANVSPSPQVRTIVQTLPAEQPVAAPPAQQGCATPNNPTVQGHCLSIR